MNKWIGVALGLGAVAAIAVAGGGAAAAGTTEGGPGGPVGGTDTKIVSAKIMANPETGEEAFFRVLSTADNDTVWAQIKLPGEGWKDVKTDRAPVEIVYYETQAKAFHSGPLALSFKGFTEEVKSLWGAEAKAL